MFRTIRLNWRAIRSGAAALGLVTAISACQDEQTPRLLAPGELVEDAVLAKLEFSAMTITPGELVTVGLRLQPPIGVRVMSADAVLRWNTSRLELVGQIPTSQHVVAMLNQAEAARGATKLVVAGATPLEGTVALLTFRVKSAGYDAGINLTFTEMIGFDYEYLDARFTGAELATGLPSASEGRTMDARAWAEHFDGGLTGSGPARTEGLAATYGDATGEGSYTGADVGFAANASVGNDALGPCIVDAIARDCGAVNVFPVTAPIGAAAATGFRSITGGDVGLVARNAVNEPGLPNMRQAIAVPAVVTVGDTACIVPTMVYNGAVGPESCNVGGVNDTLTLNVTMVNDRTLTAGTLWIGCDVLWVGRDGTATAGDVYDEATLTVEAGTWVEFCQRAALLSTRAGRVIASGTYEQPITFTSLDDDAIPFSWGNRPVSDTNGDWGGLVLMGNAIVNEQQTVAPGIPVPVAVSGGRNTGGGGNARAVEGVPGANAFFGGNTPADDCGTLRYVRVTHGGRRVNLNNELNNITVAGCGTGTEVSFVHAHSGADDGLEVFGGGFNGDHIFLTSNRDDQFDYSFGFSGTWDRIITQQLGIGDKGFEVDNTETSGSYGNTPFVNVQLSHYTMVGGANNTTPHTVGNHYRRGARSQLTDGVMVGFRQGMYVDSYVTSPGTGCAPINDGTATELSWNGVIMISLADTGFVAQEEPTRVPCTPAQYLAIHDPANQTASNVRSFLSNTAGSILKNAYGCGISTNFEVDETFLGTLNLQGLTPEAGFFGAVDYTSNESSWQSRWNAPWSTACTVP
jgi:hypothetical protein